MLEDDKNSILDCSYAKCVCSKRCMMDGYATRGFLACADCNHEQASRPGGRVGGPHSARVVVRGVREGPETPSNPFEADVGT